MSMRSLRRTLAAGFLFATFGASMALAQTPDSPGEVLRNAGQVRELLSNRAARLGTSAGGDPDTVWFGHSYTDHWSATENWWNLYVGVNRPGINDPANAIWDWDHTTGFGSHGVLDSMAGWWSRRRPYSITGGLTVADDQRPWWAVDHGNQGNLRPFGPQKRTKGTLGYWHHDPGRLAGVGVTWAPLSGGRSAWCGLRQHGDLTAMDPYTGNPFNQTILEFTLENGGGSGTNKRFPGYTNQMDQILYRDIALSPGSSMDVSFLYRTRMSTGVTTAAATRTGWFHGDPLAVTPGNFISSTAAGAAAPVDSFMVYVGSPVNEAACRYSDGTTAAVYDTHRRWFSEVLRIFEGPGVPYYEIFSTTGHQPSDTLAATPSVTVTIPAGLVGNILASAGNPGVVRLVFRVKTNQSFSDGDSRGTAYTSHSRGAAMIDDVVVNGQTIGDFEGDAQGGVGTIDNRDASDGRPDITALTNWRSTGKSPSQWFHVEAIANLTYNDLCGPPDSPVRLCNLGGVVMTAGNHDDGERHCDSRYLSDREAMHGITSPTINLVAGSTPNAMGLTSSIVDATNDYYVWYDLYAGMFNLTFTGNAWTFGASAYPASQTGNGGKCWGEVRYPSFQVFNPEPQCFQDIEPLFGLGLIATSNATGVPDSLRLALALNQQCFRFALSLGCNSSEGAYFDNVSLGFVDLPVPQQSAAGSAITLGAITADIWQFANDAFPVNETNGLPGSANFDTTTAVIKTGINNAQGTSNLLRFDIPGDSLIVKAANATTGVGDDPAYRPIRVDMVFRILPGPGNYRITAGRTFPPAATQVLLQSPTNQAAAVTPGDASFWGQYIQAPGQFAKGDHFGGTRWDYLTWNSARCDSVELNFFPTALAGNGLGGATNGTWQSTYHEADPKFTTLGIDKFKCFVVDTSKAATSTLALNNVTCLGAGPALPAWVTTVPQTRTGYNGSTTTKEHTKIIPDGLLTPGSHVQYFFRKSHEIDPLLTFAMVPDTTTITPQNGEGSTDGHRWQQFSVLPDRYKDPAFGGVGMACILFVDNCDRRGNERVFVSVMDSIGGTSVAKWGSHNGWHAASGVALGAGSGNDPAIAIPNKNQQPGTTWDMYGVKAAESLSTSAGSLGARLANRANMGFATGKQSMIAPTPEMLRTYYRVVTLLSGDLTAGVLGPFANRSQDDIALLNDFLTNAAGSAQPRGLFIQGDGFVQSEAQSGGIDPSHTDFLSQKLGLSLRNRAYVALSGNPAECADLITTSQIATNGDIYGVANNCFWSNDTYQLNPGIPEAVVATFYENVGANGPYVASVKKAAVPTRNWITLTIGWDLEHLYGRYCDTAFGRLAYFYHALHNVFDSVCTLGGMVIPLETPGATARPLRDAMALFGNPMQPGLGSSVQLSLAKRDRVEVLLLDVSGRKVRTLASREFPAGEHTLRWDGTDDAGQRLARGVYFAKVRYFSSGFEAARKVTILR